MMSQRIAWTVTRPAPFGSWTDMTFFVIFVPNVAMYRSSYSSSTERRMRGVLLHESCQAPSHPSPCAMLCDLRTDKSQDLHRTADRETMKPKEPHHSFVCRYL